MKLNPVTVICLIIAISRSPFPNHLDIIFNNTVTENLNDYNYGVTHDAKLSFELHL